MLGPGGLWRMLCIGGREGEGGGGGRGGAPWSLHACSVLPYTRSCMIDPISRSYSCSDQSPGVKTSWPWVCGFWRYFCSCSSWPLGCVTSGRTLLVALCSAIPLRQSPPSQLEQVCTAGCFARADNALPATLRSSSSLQTSPTPLSNSKFARRSLPQMLKNDQVLSTPVSPS